jgi:hypothetical protein
MKLDGYIDVPTRLKMALERFPELRVSETNPVIVKVGETMFVQVTTTVWRTPEDPIPCRASAWERTPGRTNFTADSEMMNASTSALGRALGLMGFGIVSSIASADEVHHRQQDRSPVRTDTRPPQVRTERDPEGPIPRPDHPANGKKLASDPQKRLIRRLLAERDYEFEGDVEELSLSDAMALIDLLKNLEPIK